MPLYLQTDADPGTASWGSALAQGVGTHAQLLAITGQSAGDLFYDITFGKLWVWTGLSWQVSGETVELVNDTGSPLRAGDVVIIDATLDGHVALQTVQDASDTLGVIAIDIPDAGTGYDCHRRKVERSLHRSTGTHTQSAYPIQRNSG